MFAAESQSRRLRIPVLIAAALLLLFYWLHGQHAQGDAPTTGSEWSRFAYVQYATDVHTMCNAYMIFESLHRLGSKAERVLLYPKEWDVKDENSDDRAAQLLHRSAADFGVKLKPVQLLGPDGAERPGTLEEPSTWRTSITKLRIFELEEYDRVLYFDNDALLFQHMDELFSLPSAPVVMPRRYWADSPHWEWPLSGILMLVEPNKAEMELLWERLQIWRYVPERADCQTWDDDLLDDRFMSSALVLPHRPYLLQTSEFRLTDHDGYLGRHRGPENQLQWDGNREILQAKLVHFDDWPLPKPWRAWSDEAVEEMQPDCYQGYCDNREIWIGLYDSFRKRRKDICKILEVPAPPDWQEYKRQVGAD